MRTCVACKTGADKRALVRFVRVASSLPADINSNDAALNPMADLSSVRLDRSGRMAGRGAYLCTQKGCFEKARKSKALERALRCPIPPADYDRLALEFLNLCATEHDSVGTVIHG
ncbi:MAG: YlxR family protein [Coriobacteriia bacterium]|nr:YlxR family protein [Coriobacteriia bacterium]